MTARDRVTQIRIQNFRCIKDLTIPLDGLTVLIGDNGSGKSTIIEALQLMSRAAMPGKFLLDTVSKLHGGLRSLLRQGELTLTLGVRVEGQGYPLDYTIELLFEGEQQKIIGEFLLLHDPSKLQPLRVIEREFDQCEVFDMASRNKIPIIGLNAWELALVGFGRDTQPAITRIKNALERIAVHAPFAVQSSWSQKFLENSLSPRQPAIRQSSEVEPAAKKLDFGGGNLTSVFHYLSNDKSPGEWKEILERVRLGLGDQIKDLKTPSTDRGRLELALYIEGLQRPVLAASLSDGQLSYLAMVALTETSKNDASILAFDEPENHLHPKLAAYVLWLFQDLSKTIPVILATHSDRMLDAIEDSAKSIVLCELDENKTTILKRPSEKSLALWLKNYRGVGQMRSEYLEGYLFEEPLERPISEPLSSPNLATKNE